MLVRWNFFGRHFFQFFQKGMGGQRDASLHFSIKRGLCGAAFRRKTHQVLYRDLRNETPEVSKKKYKWTQKEFDAIQHITAVATIPLYRQHKTLRGRIKDKYFGTLNFDATNDAGAVYLADPAVQQQIKGFAEFVQISLA
jgi:hypothetical protein